MPNIEFSWSRSTDIRGTVYTGDSADVFLGAYIRLMLEIDSVLYTSNIEAYTDIDNNFYIFYPDYLRQSPNIKKLLMIERIGFQRQFVNIDSIGHKGVLSVTLQPQSAFPTIHIRKGEYHIDLSPLASEGWKLPAPKDGFHDFYESICSILQKSGQKDMALHLKFSKGGVLEDIKGEDTTKVAVYFVTAKVFHNYYP